MRFSSKSRYGNLGVAWRELPVNANLTGNLERAAYGNNKLLAGGMNWNITNGNIEFCIFDDVEKWGQIITHFLPGINFIYNIKFIDGTFYIVTDGWDKIYSSIDGITLTEINLDTTDFRPTDIIKVDNTFIICGSFGSSTGALLKTIDFQNYTTITPVGLSNKISKIVYGNGLYIGNAYYNYITSTDGINWNITNIKTKFDMNYIDTLAYLNNLWIIGGKSGKIFTSIDGNIWDSRSAGTQSTIFGAAYNEEIYAVVTDNACFTSLDTITWTRQSISASGIRSINAVIDTFVILSNNNPKFTFAL